MKALRAVTPPFRVERFDMFQNTKLYPDILVWNVFSRTKNGALLWTR